MGVGYSHTADGNENIYTHTHKCKSDTTVSSYRQPDSLGRPSILTEIKRRRT